jgi:hypothetical protein
MLQKWAMLGQFEFGHNALTQRRTLGRKRKQERKDRNKKNYLSLSTFSKKGHSHFKNLIVLVGFIIFSTYKDIHKQVAFIYVCVFSSPYIYPLFFS